MFKAPLHLLPGALKPQHGCPGPPARSPALAPERLRLASSGAVGPAAVPRPVPLQLFEAPVASCFRFRRRGGHPDGQTEAPFHLVRGIVFPEGK